MSSQTEALHKIASGSVKDLYRGPHAEEIHFLFSDRVSVFDYGAIPESIAHRGASLARFAKHLFLHLDIPSAYIGDSPLGAAGICMRQARHPKFELESSSLEFIPLEVIFRWGVPEGSRLIKRGFAAFERFAEPRIEFSTKLETFDRDLGQAEAATLLPAGLSLERIEAFARDAAIKLKTFFNECGLTLWDGKVELAWNKSEDKIYLIDAITPDELRLTHEDFPRVPLSKELLRRWYQKTLWPAELSNLKSTLGQEWKSHATPPPKLGLWRSEIFSELFMQLCDVIENKSSVGLVQWLGSKAKSPRVFVAGRGGRETALRWKLQREGCELATTSENADAILVSNDGDLAHGLINTLTAKREWAVGPTREAAHLEWSKLFGKRIAELAKIPMARWTTSAAEARTKPSLPVIKQDGLAAGKGVVLPKNLAEFDETITHWKNFPLVFEDRLSGEEASVFYWIHPEGETFRVEYLGAAQDFKRRYEHDQGPNTGGMGAKSPHPTLTEADLEKFKLWALNSALALKQEGVLYSGPLFMGLMKDSGKGWMLLEYNARFGDPETQALVHLWQNPELLRSYLGLSLNEDLAPHLAKEKVLCVALVHPHYPQKSEPLQLPEWLIGSDCQDEFLFLTGSTSGRMAYLCVTGSDDLGAHAKKVLDHSPWSQLLEWRKDLLV